MKKAILASSILIAACSANEPVPEASHTVSAVYLVQEQGQIATKPADASAMQFEVNHLCKRKHAACMAWGLLITHPSQTETSDVYCLTELLHEQGGDTLFTPSKLNHEWAFQIKPDTTTTLVQFESVLLPPGSQENHDITCSFPGDYAVHINVTLNF